MVVVIQLLLPSFINNAKKYEEHYTVYCESGSTHSGLTSPLSYTIAGLDFLHEEKEEDNTHHYHIPANAFYF